MPILAKTYYTIGLMSGSSLDGLDLAYCSFTFTDSWSFDLIHCKRASLGVWENKLHSAVDLSKDDLNDLSILFAHYLAQEVQEFIQENQIKNIDAVVSHGHTIFHNPDKGVTCQIGDGQTLANQLDLKVINNLRQADIDAGGQGAPIVPIGDLHLFKDYTICLNLGGIANLSIKTKDGIVAFDVCTTNQVLNHYAHQKGFPYDDKGKMARKGKVNLSLLNKLNSLAYYQKMGPKSLDNGMAKLLIMEIDNSETKLENALATYVDHIAYLIGKDIANIANEYRMVLSEEVQLFVTGGGAFNTYLVARIQAYTKLKVVVPEEELVNYKEAIVMAFIGVLKLKNEVNVLASVTGANHDTSCGEVFEKG